MARLVGIDVQETLVRVAVLSTQYRSIKLLGMREAPIVADQTLEESIRAAGLALVQPGDHLAISVTGDRMLNRDIELPLAAAKQLQDVIPFEIEAQVPVGFDELCFDYRALPKAPGQKVIKVLAVATRVSVVQDLIDQVERALGAEPERVGAGGLPLANLPIVVPELGGPEPIGILDVGARSSDLVILQAGQPVFTRTLSVGYEQLSRTTAPLLANLRQSQAAWAQRSGQPLSRLYLAGAAASSLHAIAPALTEALALELAPLPPFSKLELAAPELQAALPGFEKALALALGLIKGARDMNLRRGTLAFHHGYEFLKEKFAVVAGLAALIVVSFGFSVWAESRSLEAEGEALTQALAKLSERHLGEASGDLERVNELLSANENLQEVDPEPRLDAFDIMLGVSNAVDKEIVHDIDELDVQKSKVKLRGVVTTTGEAERIADALNKTECYKDAKISKITQAVNSERQKYSLEFEVQCEPEGGAKKADRGVR
jgi:general secretion pathway protein L